MVYFTTNEEWLQQSTLLLQARPSTARISTKYSIAKPKPSKRRSRPVPAALNPTDPTTAQTPQPAQALLTLKTYDPVSGVCLKYRTNKAQEVGRLVQGLGRLGRGMAGLPVVEEEEVAMDIDGPTETTKVAGENGATTADQGAAAQESTEGAAKGKGKKKKGKK